MTDERPSEGSYTPPPIPPPIAPPAMSEPVVAWAPPPATRPAAGPRTTLSLAAGILLVIFGVLGVLLSLLILTIGREVARQFDFSTLPGFDVAIPARCSGAWSPSSGSCCSRAAPSTSWVASV